MNRKREILDTESSSSKLKTRTRIMTEFAILLFVLSITFTSCLAQKPSKTYYEDLSSLRPKVKFVDDKLSDSLITKKQPNLNTPLNTINEKVDALLDSIDRFNLTRKFVEGFTIQIYSGQKKEEALNASKILAESNSDLKSSTQYQQPKFRVTVGKYFSRLEAQKDLVGLRSAFPNAILVPERIMVK